MVGAIHDKECAAMAELDTSSDPRQHTKRMENVFHETADHLRRDVQKIQDPRARALFETAAEVIGGLEKAFHDYDRKDEPAWR
jgi:hypothetical protein